MVDRADQQLGNYRLLRLLGKGGFAEVYLGEHIYLKSQAAIKILHTRLTNEETGSFLSEARTLAQLHHPHIVRVLEFGIDDDTPFLVMDYAPNGTLRQRYAKGQTLPLPTVVSHVKQVADALQYAHDNKLIHRDIKPENMLIGRRNELLLSDFGIALVTQSSRFQNTQDIVGTIAYMAPEQIQGKPRPASDQYSLGIVVYEWLSGERPFLGSFTEIIAQHLAVPPYPLREKFPAISPDVEQVVMLTLAKDYHQRFSSVQAFAHALAQASQQNYIRTWPAFPVPPNVSPQQTVAARPFDLQFHTSEAVTPHISATEPVFTPERSKSQLFQMPGSMPVTQHTPHPASHLFSRRAVITSVAGLAGLSIVGGGVTWAVLTHKSPAPDPPIHRTPLPQSVLLYTYRGHSDTVTSVAWSPDGKYVASGSDDKTVHVWDAVTGSLKTSYQEDAFVVETVSWSPNGKYIASQNYNVTSHTIILHVLDIVVGNHQIDYQGAGASIAWSPDGSSLALINNSKVEVWDVTNRNLKTTLKGNSIQVYSVAWSPDGSSIVAGGYGGIVEVWDIAGNLKVSKKRELYSIECLSWSPDSKFIAWGNFNGNVEVWDAATGNLQMSYTVNAFPVTSADWSPNGKYIALHAALDTTQVLNAANGKLIIDYKGNPVPVTSASWSPNSEHIASISDLDTVEVWNATTGSLVTNYKGHSGKITSIAWSPDGSKIASGSADKTVQVWSALA